MTDPSPTPLDAATLKKQADCKHTDKSFGRGLADDKPICMHCGESKISWQLRGSPCS